MNRLKKRGNWVSERAPGVKSGLNELTSKTITPNEIQDSKKAISIMVQIKWIICSISPCSVLIKN